MLSLDRPFKGQLGQLAEVKPGGGKLCVFSGIDAPTATVA